MLIETDTKADSFDTAREYMLTFSSVGMFWSDYWMKWCDPPAENKPWRFEEGGPIGLSVLEGATTFSGYFDNTTPLNQE